MDETPVGPSGSSAAYLESMLDTDDPFNTKKKSSAMSLDDQPIGGNKSAQQRIACDADDQQPPLAASSASPPPAAAAATAPRPRPSFKPRGRVGVKSQPSSGSRAGEDEEEDEGSANKENQQRGRRQAVEGGRDGKREEEVKSTDDADTESTPVSAPVRPRPSRTPSASSAALLLNAADGASDEAPQRPAVFRPRPTAEQPPLSGEDAPLPRSSASTVAAMLDTDDPFNTKKKAATAGAASIDDTPIGGNRAAQQMFADDSAQYNEGGEGMPAPPRRPPIRQRQKADDNNGEHRAPDDESSTSSSSPPRRPPLRAKADADKKKDDKATAGSAKKPAAAAGAAASSSPSAVKLDVFKGDELLPFEEAEAALSPVLSADTLSKLQSKKWNEAVEGLTALTTEAESVGADAFVPLLPALLSYLSKYTSFKAANFNVCRAVYDAYAAALSLYLASSSTSFNVSLAFHPLSDVLNKLSDAKLVDNICHLLTVCAECAGARFMFHNVTAIISAPAFKNVKAQEAVLHWIVQLCDDFGVGSVDVATVIEQSFVWLQSTSKPVKDETAALLLSVLRQTGTLFKDKILATVKPATAKELEGMLAALPADSIGKVTATKKRKGDKDVGALNVDALVPRVDISASVSDALLKRLNDDNWKERKEAMDEVEAIIRAANCRIQAKDGGVLDVVGKWRLVDKNKNLSRDALALVALFCTAMGRPVSSYRDKVVPNLFVCLADSKKLVKDEALKTVAVWVDTAGIASVSRYLPKALMVPGSRVELLELIAAAMKDEKKWKKERKDIDLDDWIPAVISCLQDKTSEVRVQAERVCELLGRQLGFDALHEHTKSLKKAEVLKIQPTLDRLKKNAAADDAAPQDDRAADAAAAADDADEKPSAAAAGRKVGAAKAGAAAAGKTRASVASGNGSKPVVESARDRADKENGAESSGGVSSSSDALIRRVDMAAKAQRVKKDARRVKGAFREWGADEVEELNERLRELLADGFHAQLFHKDFAKQMLALDSLQSLVTTGLEPLTSILDLVLRWCSWRMCDANTAMLLKILSFLSALLQALQAEDYRMHDGEANDLLPFLIEKVLGHNNHKFRTDCRELLRLACALYDEKALFIMVTAGMDSKNKRVQSECIDVLCELMLRYGLQVGDSKKLLVQIATQVGASDATVRAAALQAMGSLYERYGDQVYALIGAGKRGAMANDCKIPPKQMAMIEERLKRIKPNSAAPDDVDHRDVTGTRTPNKHSSPPGSIAASPRPTARAVSRTPLRGGAQAAAGPTGRPGAVGRPHSSLSHRTEDDDDGTAAGSPKSEAHDNAVHSALSSSFSTSGASGSRKSFTASISTDLPSCFSLDLDSSAAGNAARDATSSSVDVRQPQPLHPSSALSSQFPSALSQSRSAPPSAASSTSSAFSLPSSAPALASPSPPPPSSWSGAVQLQANAPLVPQLSLYLSSSSEETRIEALKQLWESIIASKANIVAGQTDAVVAFLVAQIGASFLEHDDGSVSVNHRYCRYALNTLMELFKSPQLVVELSVDTLRQTAELLLRRLMDERLKNATADAQSKQLMQAINVLVLKVMENSDRTVILHVLITFLRDEHSAPTFVDLVVRCLSKLIRTFQSSGMYGIDVPALLGDLHGFLAHAPPSSHDDPSSKAVRSILVLLVQVKGEGLVADIQRCLPHDSPVLAVAERSIAAWKAKNQQSSMAGTQQYTPGFRSSVRSAAAAPTAAPAPASSTSTSSSSSASELSALVAAVLTPATTRTALTALAAFQQSHPDIDVLQAFSAQSDSFRAYVQRNIRSVATQPPAPAPSSSLRLSGGGSASTDALRQRLAALQTKAKTVAAAPLPIQSQSSAAPPAAGVAVSAPALRLSSSSPSVVPLRPSTSSASSSSRSSLGATSIDAIKQRLAAINGAAATAR